MRPLRIAAAIGGILLLALAAFAVKLGLSNPASMGIGRIAVLCAGAGLLALSALMPAKRAASLPAAVAPFARAYKGVASLLLSTLLLLGLGNGVCYLINQRYQYVADPRASLPYYRSQTWAATYWREHAEAFGRTRYEPFVIWRTAPFHGETIQIGTDGIRQTPGASSGAGGYKVFAFGGSAMLGIGSPDWGTIAAYLQEDLKPRFPAATVTNFGEKGWVSTQGIIQLIRQLQAGNVPNLAIFYDGPNDALFALENGRADGHAGRQRIGMLLEHPLAGALLDSNLSKFLVPRIGRLVPRTRAAGGDDELAAAVAETYLSNYRTVAALASQYGFKFEFFLQPIISINGKALTAEEQRMRSEMDYTAPGFAELIGKAYKIIGQRAQGLGNFRSLSNVYDGQASQVWIDWIHVTPEGNKLVAGAMAGALQ